MAYFFFRGNAGNGLEDLKVVLLTRAIKTFQVSKEGLNDTELQAG
jgi:hypothetical protein